MLETRAAFVSSLSQPLRLRPRPTNSGVECWNVLKLLFMRLFTRIAFSQIIRRLFTFRSQLRESWHIYDALKKETSWIAVIGVEKMWKLRIHVWRQNPVIGSNNMWPWQWKTSLHLTTYALSVTAVVIPGQYALPMIYTFKHQPLNSPSWRSERKAWRH